MYSLLAGVRVLDLSVLAPSMVGMHLADLGADVVKLEAPPYGDHTRLLGGPFRDGPSLSHLRWNRGKRSLGLDLRTEAGKQTYLELAAKADAIVDGMRAGATERLGVGYQAVRAANSRITYCAISGTGHSGPLKALATHGIFFDSYAGLVPVDFREDGTPYIGWRGSSIGTNFAPLFAALGVAAGIVHAVRTGSGCFLDIAQTDASALFQSDAIFGILNGLVPATLNPMHWRDAVRYQYYGTKDDRFVIFQPYERKFWVNFCNAVNRPDLLGDISAGPHADYQLDLADGDEKLRKEVAAIFRTRTQAEWIDFLIEHNIPGGPVYTLREMLSDANFLARDNVIQMEHPQAGTLHMPTTPLKVGEEKYGTRHAPAAGDHTEEILREWLSYTEEQLEALRSAAAIVKPA